MKYGKIIIGLLFIFFLTGCDVEYTATLERENNVGEIFFNEKFTINQENYLISKGDVGKKIDNYMSGKEGQIDIASYYKMKKVLGDTKSGIEFTYYYPYKQFTTSDIIHKCYDYARLDAGEDGLYFGTSDEFMCYNKYSELDKVTIHLKSEYEVVTHNADSVDGNVYTWVITRENASNKSIQFRTSTKINESVTTRNFVLEGIVIIAGVIAAGLFLIFVANIISANKRNNHI